MKYSKILCGCVLSAVLFAGGIAMADDVKLQSTPEMLEKYKNTKVYYLTDMPGEIEDFEKAIKKNPLDPENYEQIAIRYENKADVEKDEFKKAILNSKALDYYSMAIELNPYNYRYLELRASLLKKSSYSTLAAKDYQKLIELINAGYGDEQTCANLKISYYMSFANCVAGTTDKKEFLNAEKVLLQGIKHLPDNPAIYIVLGTFYKGDPYMGYKDYKKAIKAYNQALSLNPNYAFAYFNLADIYYRLEQYDTSVTYYSKAIEHANDLEKPFYYKYRADCYFNDIKDYAKAKEDYKKAVELFKTNDNKFGLSNSYPYFILECEDYIKGCDNYLNR